MTLEDKQLPLLEMYSISALMKSVFPIRSPGSKRYGHHLLTVPVVTVVDTKRTEQYKAKPVAEHQTSLIRTLRGTLKASVLTGLNLEKM